MPNANKEWLTFKIVGGVKYQVKHDRKGRRWQTRLLHPDGTETTPMTVTDEKGTRFWIIAKRLMKQ